VIKLRCASWPPRSRFCARGCSKLTAGVGRFAGQKASDRQSPAPSHLRLRTSLRDQPPGSHTLVFIAWVGRDAEVRAAAAAAGLGIFAGMLRAYAEKTGKFTRKFICRRSNVLHLLAVTRSLS
jgi:hypothetical protein